MSIPSHKITFTEDQIDEILSSTEEILRSGQVILGKHTQRFEEEYAAACERAYGVAVGSDTAAFEMQLKTLGVKGQYVLYPALAFPSILESVTNAGARPWFVDANPDGHLFASLEQIQRASLDCQDATGSAPAALILMHTGGLIARESAVITDWCTRVGIEVLEDAAHSFGATLNGDPAGSFGLSSAFSLYATKPMHACEGGMIVTDSLELAEECKIYRNYGRTQDFGRSRIVRHGYSWRITEIQSVIGLSNLRSIGASILRRREIMAMYDELISESGGVWQEIEGLPMSNGMKPNGYRYIRMLPEGWTGERRQQFKEDLKASTGIDLPGEVYELPTHKQPIWIEEYGDLSMPFAEDFCERHFALPVYQSLTNEQIRQVVQEVGKALEKAL